VPPPTVNLQATPPSISQVIRQTFLKERGENAPSRDRPAPEATDASYCARRIINVFLSSQLFLEGGEVSGAPFDRQKKIVRKRGKKKEGRKLLPCA